MYGICRVFTKTYYYHNGKIRLKRYLSHYVILIVCLRIKVIRLMSILYENPHKILV